MTSQFICFLLLFVNHFVTFNVIISHIHKFLMSNSEGWSWQCYTHCTWREFRWGTMGLQLLSIWPGYLTSCSTSSCQPSFFMWWAWLLQLCFQDFSNYIRSLSQLLNVNFLWRPLYLVLPNWNRELYRFRLLSMCSKDKKTKKYDTAWSDAVSDF